MSELVQYLRTRSIKGEYYREVSAEEATQLLGFPVTGNTFGFFPPIGGFQIRINGKWMSPKGGKDCFSALTNPSESESVWITEGSAKVTALEENGIRALGLFGVENWSVRDAEDNRILNPKIKDYLKDTSEVYLCFDSDFRTNTNVLKALSSLCEALVGYGVEPRIVHWQGEKGIDDQLAIYADTYKRKFLAQLKAEAATMKDIWGQAQKYLKKDNTILLTPYADILKPVELLANTYDTSKLFWDGPNLMCDFGGKRDTISISQVTGAIRKYVITRSNFQLETKRGTSIVPLMSAAGSKSGFITPIKQIIDDRWTQEFLRKSCPSRTFNEDPYVIGFSNGLLDLRTQKLSPTPSNYYGTIRDYPFNLNSPDPVNTIEFLKTTFGNVKKARAVIRYLLDINAGSGKIIHLKGASGTGKGTFIEMVTSALATQEFARSANPDRMANIEQLTDLVEDKRITIFPDVSESIHVLGDILELTGNKRNPIVKGTLRRRYQQAQDKKIYTRFVMASVENIRIKGTIEGGWERRMHNLTTTGNLCSEETLLGMDAEAHLIMAWALRMPLEEVTDALSGKRTDREIYLERIATSPVHEFLDGHVSKDADEAISLNEVYPIYAEWAKRTGNRPLTLAKFREQVKHALGAETVHVAFAGPRKGTWLHGFAIANDRIRGCIVNPMTYELAYATVGGLQPQDMSIPAPEVEPEPIDYGTGYEGPRGETKTQRILRRGICRDSEMLELNDPDYHEWIERNFGTGPIINELLWDDDEFPS